MKPKICLFSSAPPMAPVLLAEPVDHLDVEPHVRLTPSDIVQALKEAHELSPIEGYSQAIAEVEKMVKRRAYGAAMYVLWNIAAEWSCKYGSFTHANGRASVKTEQTETRSKKGKNAVDKERAEKILNIKKDTIKRLNAGEDISKIKKDILSNRSFLISPTTLNRVLKGINPRGRGRPPKKKSKEIDQR